MPETDTFEIGFVMAGAISAGAYTAGVMDFFIEALDAYEAAKKRPDWDGPTHDVKVPLMAGASAGGMTSAMAALQCFHEMEHVRPGVPPPAPEKNRLYSNWVRRIDLKELLKTSDLDGKEATDGVRSALCCTILDEIVHETFQMSGPAMPRAWLGRDDDHGVRVLVTLTNLRGVPYSFQVGGGSKLPYAMLNHGDYLDFWIRVPPAAGEQIPVGSRPLDIAKTQTPDWEAFRVAALATGAFPIGLAPRPIAKQVSEYDYSLRVGRDTASGFHTIKPDDILYGDPKTNPYAFVSVDGGTIDNEPLEIGRRCLANGQILSDDGATARKAIVMIAPFPSFPQLPAENDGLRLIEIIPQLSTTLIQQSRFKADELVKATDETFFSRFLISPERNGPDGKPVEKYPIASGVLGGFGGFIDETFRRHDFLLGRRNAQAFLRFHFSLPGTRDMFKGVKNREKWYVVNPPDSEKAGRKELALTTKGAPDTFGFPIIPLCGDAAAEIVITAVDYPKPSAIGRDGLKGLIDTRVAKVVTVLIDNDLLPFTKELWMGGLLREGAKHFLTQVASQKAKKTIEDAISDVEVAFP